MCTRLTESRTVDTSFPLDCANRYCRIFEYPWDLVGTETEVDSGNHRRGYSFARLLRPRCIVDGMVYQ